MTDMEMQKILAKVLSHTVRDHETVARRLYEKYGSVTRLAQTDYHELCEIEGLGEAGAHLLRTVFALLSRRTTDSFKLGKRHTDEEIEEYFKGLFVDCPNETVYCMLLDGTNKVVGVEYIGEGTVNSTEVLPRKLLEAAMNHRADKIIIAHNHPAGHPIPSVADVQGTAKIADLISASGRELVCHYIVATDRIEKIDSRK